MSTPPDRSGHPAPTGWTRAEWWGALCILGVLVLLPVGRSSELAVLAAIVAVLILRWREGRTAFSATRLRLPIQLLGCYALAIALSWPDAIDADRTATTALASIRYLAPLAMAAYALRRAEVWPQFRCAVAVIVGLWLVDAWVQFLFGYSLGGAPEAERLSGIFGADNLKLGPVLAVFSPFVLLVARERWGRLGVLAAFAFTLVPILLAGSRAAWLMFALVTVILAWREAGTLRRFLPMLIGIGLAAVIAIGALLGKSDAFESRIGRSLLALQGTDEAFDTAAAGRLDIWRASWAMFVDHPINGVGARGFREAYADYAGSDDFFRTWGVNASHAHQIVLEVLTETGVLGLLAWLLGLGLAVRAWRRASPSARERARAPGLALLAMCFPLNTHLAFYSAWWGLLFWWLLAVFCAALGAAQEAEGNAADHGGGTDQHRP